MRILLITPFPLVASQSGIYTRDIARFFSSAGHEVMVVNFDNVSTAYKEPFRINTVLFGPENANVMFPCFTTHPHTDLTFSKITNAQLNSYILYSREKIKNIIREFGPDIIHSQYLWVTTELAGESSGKIPLISTSFGNENSALSDDPRYADYVRYAVEKSMFIVAPSKQIELQLRSAFKLDAIKLKLIYRGYDDDVFKFIDENYQVYRDYFGISEKCRQIVLFSDPVNYMKGIDVFLKSALKMLEKRKDVCFVIVGKGDFSKEIESLCEANRQNILYLPSITDEEKPSLLHISDITVIPSRFEQFGTNALQSLAMGTPVISSNVGELPFFVNRENGMVLEDITEEKLSFAIEQLLEKDFKSKTKYFCHQFASRNYSKTSGLMLLQKLYDYALSEN
ncbi:MAG: glycosyltransferase family 4 protein [bacterium]|nr:glycosyltransferase family 4 protein [bacterium]